MTKKREYPEYKLQCAVAEFLRWVHPEVPFLSDVRSNVGLTIIQASRAKRIQADNFACPDMMIFKPVGKYHGMFLELKPNTPYKANGKDLRKSDHLNAQLEAIRKLRKLGYHADFYWNIDQVRTAIDEYLGGNL